MYLSMESTESDSSNHGQGVARLGDMEAFLVLKYGEVAWSQQPAKSLVQARMTGKQGKKAKRK